MCLFFPEITPKSTPKIRILTCFWSSASTFTRHHTALEVIELTRKWRIIAKYHRNFQCFHQTGTEKWLLKNWKFRKFQTRWLATPRISDTMACNPSFLENFWKWGEVGPKRVDLKSQIPLWKEEILLFYYAKVFFHQTKVQNFFGKKVKIAVRGLQLIV